MGMGWLDREVEREGGGCVSLFWKDGRMGGDGEGLGIVCIPKTRYIPSPTAME